MVSAVSSSVSMLPPVATYTNKATHQKGATIEDAIKIGNLDGECVHVLATDSGSEYASTVSTSFTTTSTTMANLSKVFSNVVSEIVTTYQLLDSENSLIASNEFTATTQQRALFDLWASGDLSLEAGTYTATATSVNNCDLSIDSEVQQGTSLQVRSQLSGGSPSEYYSFSLAGNNIKLDFNLKGSAGSARIILRNEDGNIVADSHGNSRQKSNFAKLTSATGLDANWGDYTVEVSYAKGVDTTKNLNYTMNLYSGGTYAVQYKTTATAQPLDTSAFGSVNADSDAMLYTNTDYNKIDVTPSTALTIGWLKKDQSMLAVYSQLTRADNTNYYAFTFEEGDNLKFAFNPNTTTDASGIRVQLLNSDGSRILADSEGTPDQQEAYRLLTSSSGLAADPAKYLIKVTYTDEALKNDTVYEFGVYSGTTYKAQYKTLASAQTYENAALVRMLGTEDAPPEPLTMGTYLSTAESDPFACLATALKLFV